MGGKAAPRTAVGQTGGPLSWPRLTATVTATATTTGQQLRAATAHTLARLGANVGYGRPEKRTVAVQLACN
jgi:hypothetical protein